MVSEKQIKKEALRTLLQYKKEELKELEEFIKPKRFIDRFNTFFMHSAIANIKIINIKIKHAERQTKLLELTLKRIEEVGDSSQD